MRQNDQRTPQEPMGSGFNAGSTSKEVIKGADLSGMTAVITGGYAGIGLETTRTLAAAGAVVWVPVRDREKAMRNLYGIPNVQVQEMNLTDPESIEAFITKFRDSGRSLDLLINNAGIMWVPLQRDSRGFESQLLTNHLGHFQLTAGLWPALKKAGRARVINLSSYGHQMAPFNFEDPHFLHREYQTLAGYGQSKTANNLFTVELDERGKNSGVRSFAVHPGSVAGTDLGRVAPMQLFQQMGTHDADGNIFESVAAKLKTVEQGAATTVWCAVDVSLENTGGVYCENCDIAEIDEGQIDHQYDEPLSLRGVQPYSIDKENAKRLWRLSEEMTGVIFNAD